MKLGHYGHTTRKYESLEKELIQGCTPGNRSRGRQRRRWTDDIIEWTGLTINEAAGSTQDRDRWRGILRAANRSSEGRHRMIERRRMWVNGCQASPGTHE